MILVPSECSQPQFFKHSAQEVPLSMQASTHNIPGDGKAPATAALLTVNKSAGNNSFMQNSSRKWIV
jgi:hypothetical protein